MSGYAPPRRRRRRRRRHTSALVRTPEQLQQQGRQRRISSSQILACSAVAVIGLALIVLVWINTSRAIREQADDQRGRVEAALTAQAVTLSEQAQHELLMIDQSLAILQAAWDDNPDRFKLDDWRKKMPALTAVADDLFIADNRHVIEQDIVPAAIGQGIGAAYTSFANGSLEPIKLDGPDQRDNAMLVGELGSGGVMREYLMYLVRPLAKPAGWLIGASYRLQALTEVFAHAGLGTGGFAALVDMHRGGVQALAGSAAVRPVLSIDNTDIYSAMVTRPDGGIWVGRTPIDDIERIIAFRRVPGRDLIVLVGETSAVAMSPSRSWAAAARTLAVVASVLVLAIAGAVLWEVYNWRHIRHRQRALVQTRGLLAGVQTELAALRVRAALSEAQLHALLGSASTGIAVLDAEQRLVNWTPRFAEWSRVSTEVLREGLPLNELLRQQALVGLVEVPVDLDADIARQMALLAPQSGVGTLEETLPDGSRLVMQSRPTPNGGRVLTVDPATMPIEKSAPASAAETVDATASADAVEW